MEAPPDFRKLPPNVDNPSTTVSQDSAAWRFPGRGMTTPQLRSAASARKVESMPDPKDPARNGKLPDDVPEFKDAGYWFKRLWVRPYLT